MSFDGGVAQMKFVLGQVSEMCTLNCSSDSEEGPITVAPIQQPVAKTQKKAKAKVADTGDISGDDDGMVPTPIYCRNL